MMTLLISFCHNINAQNFKKSLKDSVDFYEKFNFFKFNYKFLKSDYTIKITDKQFQEIILKYKYYPKSTYQHSDSLQIVLASEFKSDVQRRMAYLRLSYTWERVGLFCRESSENLKKYAKNLKIEHPYEFKTQLENKNQENNILINILANLRKELRQQYTMEIIDKMSNNELLNFSFKNNPKVHEIKKSIFDKRSLERFVAKHKRQPTEDEKKKLGFECGKENCCQKK